MVVMGQECVTGSGASNGDIACAQVDRGMSMELRWHDR